MAPKDKNRILGCNWLNQGPSIAKERKLSYVGYSHIHYYVSFNLIHSQYICYNMRYFKFAVIFMETFYVREKRILALFVEIKFQPFNLIEVKSNKYILLEQCLTIGN